MNFTFHLTEQCNMDCSYCIREKHSRRMSEKTMKAACELAFSKGNSAGICFFGGEPLLERGLIEKALDYCQQLSAETGKPFYCKMTTNGTLMDQEFIQRAKKARLQIGISFDGLAQDLCRRYKDGSESFRDMEQIAQMLLQELPDSYAMMTIAPQAVHRYADSVKYLHNLGFRKVTGTIAYGKRVHWTDEHLEILKKELLKLAAFYSDLITKGEYFFFSPFDSKIRECISGQNPSERCHLGFRQMPVYVDGKIYACTQFIGDEEYCLGNVFDGIDVEKQIVLSRRSAAPESCKTCDLNTRCTNSCGCMNRMETGDETQVSPLQCAYERMLITICDDVAETLFQKEPQRFQKRFVSI